MRTTKEIIKEMMIANNTAYMSLGICTSFSFLWISNRLNIFTPQTKNYWTTMVTVAIIFFIIGVLAFHKSSNSTQADSKESVS